MIGEHPAIAECAIVGVPSELGDEELKLFARLTEGAQVTPQMLVEWCQPRMPAFQVPRFIAFIDEFPKTPTQRIRKNELPRNRSGAWDAEQARS